MRREASILHLDLDAFFASVEQRDKPSLRGKPVIVGGVGQRGVVATASYEARVFGVRSAMPMHEARRRCPNAAFLSGRFGAYRAASEQVMRVLRELSPLVEPLSLDEAFVDLTGATRPVDLSASGLARELGRLKREVAEATDGLTASVGAASSKFMAKLGSELGKPDGLLVIEPGTERELLGPLAVGVIPGVGPVTAEKLHRLGIRTIADLRAISVDELAQTVGRSHAQGLADLAQARDDRPVVAERETKSISVEDTFETDLVDGATLLGILDRDARTVAARLRAAGLFARTVTIKVRLHDFSTYTRSRSLLSATNDPDTIADIARSMLSAVDVSGGVRLLGAGVAGLTDVLQEGLFDDDVPAPDPEAAADPEETPTPTAGVRQRAGWPPGADVRHTTYGDGWVWGSGLGRVTVRFETRTTPPGPVRTFDLDDPALHHR